MSKIYTHSPNSLRPKRQSANMALESPEDEAYSYPQDTNIPTRIKVEDIGESESFVYMHKNGEIRRLKGVNSDFQRKDMVFVIDTTKSSGTEFRLGLAAVDGQAVDVTVNWGDGSMENFNTSGNKIHTYAEEGVYEIIIKGTFPSTDTPKNEISQQKIIEMKSWGEVGLLDGTDMFRFTGEYLEISQPLPPTVTNISGMFRNSEFNKDISNWDVSNVKLMSTTFQDSKFNKDISNWDVSNVTSFFGTFQDSDFNQNLGNWVLPFSVPTLNAMFNASGMSPENYARTLIGWANNIFSRGGNDAQFGQLGATQIEYASDVYSDIVGEFDNAIDARSYLINTADWMITDAGEFIPPPPIVGSFTSFTDWENDNTLSQANVDEGELIFIAGEVPIPGGFYEILYEEPVGTIKFANQNSLWILLI